MSGSGAGGMQLGGERRLKLGILGSAGLEIATGLPFTNSESDLVLLITGLSLQQLQEDIYRTAGHWKEVSGRH